MGKTPFYFVRMGSLGGRVVSSALSAFFGALSSLRLTGDILRNRSRFFAIIDRTGPNRPSVLDQYGEHRFVRLPKQNIRLHYVESGDQARQPMVLVHGFPECWFSWRHQIRHFQADYRVLAVNMRGYGESDKPVGVSNYSTATLVADLSEFIETQLTSSHRKCVLVAHDWGGVVAWLVAQHRPDLVDRFIVLNAPHPVCWQRRIATSWRQFAASWYVFFFNLPWLPELSFRGNDFRIFNAFFGKYSKDAPEEIDAYKHYFAQPYGITGPLNYYRAMVRGYDGGGGGASSTGAAPGKVKPKTLVVWGRDDTALISELAEDSAQQCEDAQVQYLDKCSHWIQIHRPKEVNQIMDKFLKQH